MATKYSHEFTRFFNLTRVFAKLCGVDLVRYDYRMTWVTWSLLALINCAVAFTLYTIYVATAVNNNWIDVIKCQCMFCTGLQIYAKLINGLKRPQMIYLLYAEILDIYVIYENKTGHYHQLLSSSLKLMKKLIWALLIIMTLTLTSIIGIPFFYQIVFKERIFVMPFFLPYVDYESDFGYYFTSAFHAVCVFFGIVGNFINDSICFVYAAHIPLMKNILQVKFKELDQVLQNGLAKEKLEAAELLMDIFKWHQKYIGFCKTVKVLFFWVIFVQVAMAFASIVCTIVSIFMGVWPAAPLFLIYSFALFYCHCALGNLVEVSNDDVTTMVYDCCWHKLTIPQQKMMLIMFRASQQAEGMSIGGVAPLTMHTAVQLTKTIYTLSMMLKNYFN